MVDLTNAREHNQMKSHLLVERPFLTLSPWEKLTFPNFLSLIPLRSLDSVNFFLICFTIASVTVGG